jgi:hypothetical protein
MPKRRHRSFGGGKKVGDFGPVDFDLGTENFKCKPAIQGAVLLEFVAAADSDSGGKSAAALYGFFADVMLDGEYDRFRAHLKNTEVIYDIAEIGEIAGWLVEEYAERPTEPSKSSSSGRSSSGPGSTDED